MRAKGHAHEAIDLIRNHVMFDKQELGILRHPPLNYPVGRMLVHPTARIAVAICGNGNELAKFLLSGNV